VPATFLYDNHDGTYRYRREDGREVDVPMPPEAMGITRPEPTVPVLLASGQQAQVPKSELPAALADPLAAPVVDAPAPHPGSVPVPLRNGQTTMVPREDVQLALADPLAAPVTTVPSAQPGPRTGGKRIIAEKPNPLGGAGSTYVVEDEQGLQEEVPAQAMAGAIVDNWKRQQQGLSAAQPVAEGDTRAYGEMSPAEALATRRARGEPEPAQPTSLFGMSVGGASAAPVSELRTSTGPAPAPAPAEPEKKPEGLLPVDAFVPAAAAASNAPAATPAPIRFSPAGAGQGERDLKEAYALQREAVAQSAAVAEQQAAAEQARLDAELEAEQARQAREAEAEQKRQQAMQRAEEEYATALKSMETPSGQLDPERWWNSRSTGQKILAVTSAFFSGFGGSTSPIFKFIDEDIAAQRFNLERADEAKKARAAGKLSLLGVMRERFGDERTADIAARAAAVEYARKVAEREAADFKGSLAQARAKELVGQLAAQEAVEKQKLRQASAELAIQQFEMQLQALQFQKAQQAAQVGAVAEAGNAVPLSSLTAEQKKRAVELPGSQGLAVLALDEDSAKKLRETTVTSRNTLAALDTLRDLRRQYGPEALNREAVAKMRSASGDLVSWLNKSKKFGSLDEGAQALLREISGGDPTRFGYVLPVLEQLRNSTVNEYRTEFETLTGRNLGRPGFTQRETQTP
jgi:hypothetical protein